MQQSQIWTAEQGVLSGLTRRQVLNCAARLHIPVHFEPAFLAELPQLEEAFITSASRGVLPVVQIDEQRIGAGRPGPLTCRVMHAYEQAVQEQLQVI